MTRFIHIDGFCTDVLSRWDGSEVVVTPTLILF